MHAAFCVEPKRFELREIATPAPGPDHVLIRVRNCGICGSDLHYFHGSLPVPGVCPGHEISGEVAEIGAAVTNLHCGDRVAVEPLIVCHRCPACRTGDYQLCRQFQLLGTQADGGFAEYVCMPASAVFPVPVELDFPVAALTEPTAVCVHGVRLAGVRLGDRVLVLGGGSIGLLSVLAARAAGATEVWITARHPHQRELAQRFGARVFGDDQTDEVASHAYDHPVDVVIETVGGGADTMNDALLCVRPGGTVVTLGVFTGAVELRALFLVLKEVRIVGSLTYGRAGVRADFDIALDLLRRHRDLVAPLVTHRFPLAQIETGFAVASDKAQRSVKVSITP